jgi:hypothetical protein
LHEARLAEWKGTPGNEAMTLFNHGVEVERKLTVAWPPPLARVLSPGVAIKWIFFLRNSIRSAIEMSAPRQNERRECGNLHEMPLATDAYLYSKQNLCCSRPFANIRAKQGLTAEYQAMVGRKDGLWQIRRTFRYLTHGRRSLISSVFLSYDS